MLKIEYKTKFKIYAQKLARKQTFMRNSH